MGGYTNFGSLDDGATGDGIGSGLTDSIDSFSGDESLADPTLTSDVTGSDVQLDFSNGATGLGVSDLWTNGSLTDENSLSGVTSGTLSSSSETGESSLDTNGEGTAGIVGVSKTAQPGGSSELSIGALGKFGASLAGVLTGNHPAMVGGVPIGAKGSVAYDANGRPITRPGVSSSSISANHTTLIVSVVIVLAIVLAFLPGARKAVS